MADISALGVFISFASGGVAGAIITAIATSVRNKNDLALKIVDGFIDKMFDKIATAIDALSTPLSMAAPGARDKVANVANWFEVVAACYLDSRADAGILLSMGLPDQCKQFYTLISKARVQVNGTEGPVFDEEELASYTYLRRLVSGEIPALDASAAFHL